MIRGLLFLCIMGLGQAETSQMEWIRVSPDRKGFVAERSGKKFVPWGFNYDHDDAGRLLEDYWETEWPKVEAAFRDMKKMGANTVRIHLQFGKFMDSPDRPKEKSLGQLDRLLRLAEQTGLYLDLTGLGCYHKRDVPAWYDELDEAGRWKAQVKFWQAIAQRAKDSPTVFCYDLMNEPVVPGGKRKSGDWLGPPFGDKHFVQVITLDQAGRQRFEIARKWIKELVAGIRSRDRRHLITVGLVDWSLDRPGLTSGFIPDKVAGELDFVCVHLYPRANKVEESLNTLAGFAVGKPVVIEETFPLFCSQDEFGKFMAGSRRHATGWIGFYWGKPPEELKKSRKLGDALLRKWLEYFEKATPQMTGSN
jgi:hypothetical protein